MVTWLVDGAAPAVTYPLRWTVSQAGHVTGDRLKSGCIEVSDRWRGHRAGSGSAKAWPQWSHHNMYKPLPVTGFKKHSGFGTGWDDFWS